MGQRANLVIVRNGDWQLYYDHWCANRLDVELFWGPELAADFIEQRDPLEDRNDWLDEVWCEGGAVLDEDHRVLVWFGGEDIMDDVPLRRAFLSLMEMQWPGWEINWATGGIIELGAYVNIPAEELLVDNKAEYGFQVLTDYPEDNRTLLTLRQNKQTLAGRVSGDREALRMGFTEVTKLQSFPLQANLVWTGDMPVGGLHIDIDDHALCYWLADRSAGIEERVQRSWQGWRTKCLRDQFEEQLRIANIDITLPHRNLIDLQLGTVRRLRHGYNHFASNPARELSAGMNVTYLNPWSDETRSSVNRDAEKLRILDALEEQLQKR